MGLNSRTVNSTGYDLADNPVHTENVLSRQIDSELEIQLFWEEEKSETRKAKMNEIRKIIMRQQARQPRRTDTTP